MLKGYSRVELEIEAANALVYSGLMLGGGLLYLVSGWLLLRQQTTQEGKVA